MSDPSPPKFCTNHPTHRLLLPANHSADQPLSASEVMSAKPSRASIIDALDAYRKAVREEAKLKEQLAKAIEQFYTDPDFDAIHPEITRLMEAYKAARKEIHNITYLITDVVESVHASPSSPEQTAE